MQHILALFGFFLHCLALRATQSYTNPVQDDTTFHCRRIYKLSKSKGILEDSEEN